MASSSWLWGTQGRRAGTSLVLIDQERRPKTSEEYGVWEKKLRHDTFAGKSDKIIFISLICVHFYFSREWGICSSFMEQEFLCVSDSPSGLRNTKDGRYESIGQRSDHKERHLLENKEKKQV